MSAFVYSGGTLCVEDVPLKAIGQEVETPAYVYSATRIENNFKAYLDSFKKILPNTPVTVCFACKANSNISVLKLLNNIGAGADIVSKGELERTKRAGIPANKVVFSGVGKSAEEIEKALAAGIFQFNVESIEELKHISEIAQKLGVDAPVALRMNPDVDAKTHRKITTGKKENKFGIDYDAMLNAYKIATELPNIAPKGVAMHIGSQLTEVTPFAEAFARMRDMVLLLRDQGYTVERIDLGGGIGVTYHNYQAVDLNKYLVEYAQLVRDILDPLQCHIIIEPGRSIVGDAGVLVSRVLYVKQGTSRQFVILDAAMNDLMRPALYDAYHPILPCTEPVDGAPLMEFDVVGPVCETGDSFALSEEMPLLKEGDYVALMVSGAYGAVMGSTYNTRALAAEVLVKDNRFDIIRKRWRVEDILSLEEQPDWITE